MKLRPLIKKKRKFIPKNKRGAIGIIIFFAILLLVLILGFVATMAWSIWDIASDEITPVMTSIGLVGDANVSEYAEWSFGTLDTIVQALPWIIALSYLMALVFTLVFVFVVGYSPHPAFIGLYFMLMVLLVLGCIVMSNMYQDVYTGTDEIATRLQEQSTTSYLILHSPFIMGLIAVIGGVLMFTRQSSAEGGGSGGFGI